MTTNNQDLKVMTKAIDAIKCIDEICTSNEINPEIRGAALAAIDQVLRRGKSDMEILTTEKCRIKEHTRGYKLTV